jgi:hypothetical protein
MDESPGFRFFFIEKVSRDLPGRKKDVSLSSVRREAVSSVRGVRKKEFFERITYQLK